MYIEFTTIKRVESFIRHPPFAGSDGIMENALDDLESRTCAHQISQTTYRRLREMIERSPQSARNN